MQHGFWSSHLAALRNDNVHVGHVLAAVARLGGLHLLRDVEALDYPAENDVLLVEKGGRDGGDEELGAVGVGTGVLGKGEISPSVIGVTREGGNPKQANDFVLSGDRRPDEWARLGRCEFRAEQRGTLTAMDSRPGLSCFRSKFSSAKEDVP